MSAVKTIQWVWPSSEARLLVTVATHREGGRSQVYAAAHAAIAGRLYAIVQESTSYGTRSRTYEQGDEGVMYDMGTNESFAHYEFLRPGERPTLVSCNGTGGLRGRKCSLCKEAVAS